MYIAQGNALGYIFANNYLPKGAKALEIYAFAGYDTMGNPTWIYRKSPNTLENNRPSSPSDRLRLEYDGNQLVHVTDNVSIGHTYAGAFHFVDGVDETMEPPLYQLKKRSATCGASEVISDLHACRRDMLWVKILPS